MTFFERVESLRKSKNISQGKLEKELGFSNGSISKWRTSMPTPERLQKISDYFGVSIEYLMTGIEEPNKKETMLTPKDKREIGRDLNRIMHEIENDVNGPLFYEGKPISQKHLILLKNAIEIALEDAKRKNKETYTPKKYKDKEEN